MDPDKRYVVLGFARQGMALAQYLAMHGARVTVSDMHAEIPSLDAFRSKGISFELGAHPISLLDDCDVLFLSGGIPNDAAIVVEAGQRGIEISNDAQLFLDECPATIVVGITGSAGKTTTTILTYEMLIKSSEIKHVGEAPKSRIWVGGNIGNALISDVDEMTATDRVIIELSSFQLEWMHRSPSIACITNLSPNHLDRHASMADYVSAKRTIVEFQSPNQWAVLNADDVLTREHIKPVAQVAWFSLKTEPSGFGGWLDDAGDLQLRLPRSPAANKSVTATICNQRDVKVIGEHNVANVLAAGLLATLAGADLAAISHVAKNFTGVPHRLELVRDQDDIRWYNDSIATAPERLMAGLRAFKEPVVLLVGGRDKYLPWDAAVTLMADRCRHVVFFGELGPMVARKFALKSPRWSLVGGLRDAIQRASEVAKPNDVVLLSPGGTGFDQYKDFADRGDDFRTMVAEL